MDLQLRMWPSFCGWNYFVACMSRVKLYSHWVAAAAKHSLNRNKGVPRLLGEENVFLVLLIFVFRINFYDFRGKLPCFLLLSCCFSFAIWKLARETMRKGGEGGRETHIMRRNFSLFLCRISLSPAIVCLRVCVRVRHTLIKFVP